MIGLPKLVLRNHDIFPRNGLRRDSKDSLPSEINAATWQQPKPQVPWIQRPQQSIQEASLQPHPPQPNIPKVLEKLLAKVDQPDLAHVGIMCEPCFVTK